MGKVTMLEYSDFQGDFTYLEILSSKEKMSYTFPVIINSVAALDLKGGYKSLLNKDYMLEYFRRIQLGKDAILTPQIDIFLYLASRRRFYKKFSKKALINMINQENLITLYKESRLDVIDPTGKYNRKEDNSSKISIFELFQELKITEELCRKSPDLVKALLYRNYLIDTGKIIGEPRI